MNEKVKRAGDVRGWSWCSEKRGGERYKSSIQSSSSRMVWGGGGGGGGWISNWRRNWKDVAVGERWRWRGLLLLSPCNRCSTEDAPSFWKLRIRGGDATSRPRTDDATICKQFQDKVHLMGDLTGSGLGVGSGGQGEAEGLDSTLCPH